MHLSSSFRIHRLLAAVITSIFSAALIFSAEPPEKKKPEEKVDEIITLEPFTCAAGSSVGYSCTSTLAGSRLGATPGGAKDIRFFRAGAARGEIPHPNTFTSEGLFSEHDLPLDLGVESEALFRVQSAATE